MPEVRTSSPESPVYIFDSSFSLNAQSPGSEVNFILGQEAERDIFAALLNPTGVYNTLLDEAKSAGYTSYTKIEDIFRKGNCRIVVERLAKTLSQKYPRIEIMMYKSRLNRCHYFLKLQIGTNSLYIDPTWQQFANEFDESLPPVAIWWQQNITHNHPPFFNHISTQSYEIWGATYSLE